MRISDWSSDVCSSDLVTRRLGIEHHQCKLLAVGRKRIVGDRALDTLKRLCLAARQREQPQPAFLILAFLARARGNERYCRSVGAEPGAAFAFARAAGQLALAGAIPLRSEEHTSELQSLMRTSYAVFC